MFVVHEENEQNFVDLFTQDEHPISLRDALLYTNYVKSKSRFYNEKTKTLQEHKKTFLYKKSMKTIFKESLAPGENIKVDVKHLESPMEFYAMKVKYGINYEIFQFLNFLKQKNVQ